jgi:hypothetical protein
MRHIADLRSDVFNIPASEDGDGATSGLGETGNNSQQGCLTGAVLAENNKQASGREFTSDATQRSKRAELLDEPVDDNGLVYVRVSHQKAKILYST